MEKFLKTPDFAIKCGKRTEHEIRMLRLIDYSTEFREKKPYLLIYQSRNHLGRVERPSSASSTITILINQSRPRFSRHPTHHSAASNIRLPRTPYVGRGHGSGRESARPSSSLRSDFAYLGGGLTASLGSTTIRHMGGEHGCSFCSYGCLYGLRRLQRFMPRFRGWDRRFSFNLRLQHHVLVAWVQEAAVYILRRHLWEQVGD